MSLTISGTMSTPRLLTIGIVLFANIFLIGCSGNSNGYSPFIGVGDVAPKSNNKTVATSKKWYEVSTMDSRVDLYGWNMSELIDRNKPFLVVFGTPQHCTMCVDQIVRIAIMQEKHGNDFAFIHVDGYKDNAVWVEWGVKGEPWTFFVDAGGIVTKVYPGQTEIALLENEMKNLLKAVN